MVKSYAEKAKIFRGRAISKRSAAMHTKDVFRKNSLLEEAATWYETAGENWVLEGEKNISYPRIVRFAHLNAVHDYRMAKTIRKEIIKKDLEARVYATASIISLIGALFFVSFGLTGSAVGSLARGDSSLLGIVFFVLGLVMFIFFKTRKK